MFSGSWRCRPDPCGDSACRRPGIDDDVQLVNVTVDALAELVFAIAPVPTDATFDAIVQLSSVAVPGAWTCNAAPSFATLLESVVRSIVNVPRFSIPPPLFEATLPLMEQSLTVRLPPLLIAPPKSLLPPETPFRICLP